MAVGLWLLGGASTSNFDTGKALGGILSQLPATFPAAISIFLATAINVGAGAVIVRRVRWAPFASISELIVCGLAGAVLLDLLLLLVLGRSASSSRLPWRW